MHTGVGTLRLNCAEAIEYIASIKKNALKTTIIDRAIFSPVARAFMQAYRTQQDGAGSTLSKREAQKATSKVNIAKKNRHLIFFGCLIAEHDYPVWILSKKGCFISFENSSDGHCHWGHPGETTRLPRQSYISAQVFEADSIFSRRLRFQGVNW